MSFTYIRRAAVALALIATAGCTVKNTEPPPLSGPSGLALTLRLSAIPDSISQDGGSQSSVRVTAIGPDGKPVSALPLRMDMMVNGVATDFGTLSARSIVTNTDGVATVVYTAPPAPPNGVFTPCVSASIGSSLPGSCVSIVASATATNFATSNPESVLIRLVPLGVILPPASTPAACFTMSPSSAAASITLQFTGGTLVNNVCQPATSDITTFAWTFGDGSSASGRVVSHIFAVANTFNVTLIETNDRGVSGSTTQQVNVGGAALPTPLFTFSPAAPAVNESVFFNGSTSIPGTGHTTITSYRWTFGDGGSASGATVSHAYATSGTYTVQLTVTDEAGQSNTSGGTAITVGNPPVPTANFTSSPNAPATNQPVVFDASGSTTAQGQTIVDYAWNFGDGTPVVHGTFRTIAHVFTAAGVYQVNLVVTDSAGRTGSKVNSVTVGGGGGDATFPTASFTVVPQPATVNQEVSFDGSGSSRGSTNSPIVTYTWNFGDGSPVFSSSAPNVGYTYRTRSNFTATLTVTDAANKSSTTTRAVLVQ